MNLEDIDPELAALLDKVQTTSEKPVTFPKLSSEDTSALQMPQVDISLGTFNEVKEFYSDTPHNVFNEPDYYKTALSGESESSHKLHNLLTKFLTCQDSKDRAVYRQQIATIYWDFLRSLVRKAGAHFSPSKKYLLRYGLVLPSLLTVEQKNLFAAIIDDNKTGEPIYYLDEWFSNITKGIITPSATDEARPARKTENSHFRQLQNKIQGKLQSADSFLRAKEDERSMMEGSLLGKMESICKHNPIPKLEAYAEPLNEIQKKTVLEINELMKSLMKIDRELSGHISDYFSASEELKSINDKINNDSQESAVSAGEIVSELETVRQMAKMTVGRQGNHFPILTREYFHCSPKELGTRENVLNTLRWIESVDPEVFFRIHKNQKNRIVPFVILIPSYGDTGFCWEPFDRYNRITSRGRIAVPMYPKNLQIAVLSAVADLRWQVAKEKASYRW
ncbi:MAG: hypothetical protein LBR47_06085, partial [Spirochaetaceae bacterium]|nr:hypothetical protein [Spirochaetaceae bacterium]